ncbi:P2Y purinoceptor 1-like [Labrus mixtus]|uniref:P2Y purinoceptor 1-like n=1 Tax=Labrus mixtus TaxID=508554 RepID=UPI0029C0E8E9|nr:P2Y purinoceptor 1-like [Labrus mixtus]
MITPNFVNAIHDYCDEIGWHEIWWISDIFFLFTGVLANTALLWLFLQERKPLSASQVLGVNVVVMDLIYLSIMPIRLFFDAKMMKEENKTRQDFSLTGPHDNVTNPWETATDVFKIFNLIGCPLLLSCMCIERYLAVIKPVLYLKVRKWEYRMAVSAVVWVITLSFCMASAIVEDMTVMMAPVSITVSCLFILMLACLCSMIWSLMQQSPAHTTLGNQACSEPPLKRQAVCNVLVVVVPAVISYLPVLPMVPLLVYIQYRKALGIEVCNVFELSELFPRFGVFIGPLFYLSRARKMCCLVSFKPSRKK